MMGKQLIATAIMLMVGLAALGQTRPANMKGYELYSWKSGGKWHYSLLPGTNRLKSIEEITSNKGIKVGDTALKGELKKIARGQEVFWMSDGPVGMRQSPGNESLSMKLPSRKRIEGIISYCNKLGIKLTLR